MLSDIIKKGEAEQSKELKELNKNIKALLDLNKKEAKATEKARKDEKQKEKREAADKKKFSAKLRQQEKLEKDVSKGGLAKMLAGLLGLGGSAALAKGGLIAALGAGITALFSSEKVRNFLTKKLGEGFDFLKENMKKVFNLKNLQKVFDSIRGAFNTVFSEKNIEKLTKFIGDAFRAVFNKKNMESLWKGIKMSFNFLVDFGKDYMKFLQKFWFGKTGILGEDNRKAMANFFLGTDGIFGSKNRNNLIKGIKGGFSKLGDSIAGLMEAIFGEESRKKLVEGMRDGFVNLGDSISGLWNAIFGNKGRNQGANVSGGGGGSRARVNRRQTGGPITVPGTGSGDKVPMALPAGSFVLNRNASNFLRRQEGGTVPSLLEPGELVYLNDAIPRFQTGGTVSHPQTGTGYQPGSAKDSNGRPVVLSQSASDSFKKMMDAGGVKGSDIASSQRSKSHNSKVGGARNSHHLYGNAMDIHGSSKAWLKNGNAEKYGWRLLDSRFTTHDGHFDYIGKGSEKTNTKVVKETKEKEGGGFDWKKMLTTGLGGVAGAVAGAAFNPLGAFGINANPMIMGALMGASAGSALANLFGFGDSDDSSGRSSYSSGGGKGVPNDPAFKSEVTRLAKKYDIPEKNLYAVMSFETGGSFDPAQKNMAGSGATGLIQFMPDTARGLGTTTSTLAQMTRADQMKYVEKHFDSHKLPKGASLSDLYMSILLPAAVGKSENYKLFGKGGLMPGAYAQNAGLDADGDGSITKHEATSKVRAHLQKGGMVNTLLEPGEMVFPKTTQGLQSLNSTIPRFQSGGMVDNSSIMEDLGSTPIVVVAPNSGGGASSQQAPQSANTGGPPKLSDGPSMAALSDVINRVSWSNVF